jgi:hypothetical protein
MANISETFTSRAREAFPSLEALCLGLKAGAVHALAEELGADPEQVGVELALPTYGGSDLSRDEARRLFAWSWDAARLLVGEAPDEARIVPRP